MDFISMSYSMVSQAHRIGNFTFSLLVSHQANRMFVSTQCIIFALFLVYSRQESWCQAKLSGSGRKYECSVWLFCWNLVGLFWWHTAIGKWVLVSAENYVFAANMQRIPTNYAWANHWELLHNCPCWRGKSLLSLRRSNVWSMNEFPMVAIPFWWFYSGSKWNYIMQSMKCS